MTADATASEQAAPALETPEAAWVGGVQGYATFSGDGSGRAAIWQLGPHGERSGAWVVDDVDALDEQTAARYLTVVERRVPVGVAATREQDLEVLHRLAVRAGTTVPAAYEHAWLDLAAALEEIVETRQQMSRALGAARVATRRALSPLIYDLDVPSVPSDAGLAELLVAHKRHPPQATDEVSTTALGKCYVLTALIELWADTEATRVRREYLHGYAGATGRPLPPSWMRRHDLVHPTRFAV